MYPLKIIYINKQAGDNPTSTYLLQLYSANQEEEMFVELEKLFPSIINPDHIHTELPENGYFLFFYHFFFF